MPPRDHTIPGLSVKLILINIFKQITKLGEYLACTCSRYVSVLLRNVFGSK